MKQIRILLTILLISSCVCQLIAQNETKVKGKYKGKWIYMEYNPDSKQDEILKIEYDRVELTKLIKDLNDKIAVKDQKIKELEGKSSSQIQPQNQSSKKEDSLLRQQNNALLEEKWILQDQLKSLQDTVRLLKDSVRLLNASLEKMNDQLAILLQKRTSAGTSPGVNDDGGSHIGAYYRVGCPWLINNILDSELWSRKVNLSHQVGIYWNSKSFSDKLPMTCGVGLEYSRLKFSAEVGHLEKEPFVDLDRDGDSCTAFLTYNNVVENASLHYLSIPLTFSFGAPRNYRVSGYFQVSLVPSFLIKDCLTASGRYSLSGEYNVIDGSAVDIHLYNIPDLGYYTNHSIVDFKNEALLNRFVLTGRLSGGVFIPLCNTLKGETSQWSIKIGVNIDVAISRVNQKEKVIEYSESGYETKANYLIKQNDLLSGSGCRYINPGLEVGILYMFNK